MRERRRTRSTGSEPERSARVRAGPGVEGDETTPRPSTPSHLMSVWFQTAIINIVFKLRRFIAVI